MFLHFARENSLNSRSQKRWPGSPEAKYVQAPSQRDFWADLCASVAQEKKNKTHILFSKYFNKIWIANILAVGALEWFLL